MGDRKLVTSGLLLSVVAFVALAWTFGIRSLLIVTAFIAFGTGVVRPAITSLITQRIGKWEQGAVLGLTQSLQSVAAIVAPFLAGLLIEHGQLHLWAIMAAVSAGIGLLLQPPQQA